VVDDVDYLRGRYRTQLEFLRFISEACGSGTHVVLTASQAPTEIPLHEPLLRFLQRGSTLQLRIPGLQTMIEIVRRKSRQQCLELTDYAVFDIARNSKNPRQVYSSLARLELRRLIGLEKS
jgi:chromosomal replication initiator protein